MKVNAKELNDFLKKLTLAKRIEIVALEPYKGKLVCVADASEEVTIIANSDIDWDDNMEPVGVTLKNLSTFLSTQGNNDVYISVEDVYYLVFKGNKGTTFRHHLTDIRYVDTYLEDMSAEYLEVAADLKPDLVFENKDDLKDLVKLLKASKDIFMYFMSEGGNELTIGSGNSNSDVVETKINMLTTPDKPVTFKTNREDFLKVMVKVSDTVFFTFSVEEGEPSTLLIVDRDKKVTYELWEKE
jgi:hypothetical protein